MPHVPSNQVVFTIPEFCRVHRISVGTFYNLIKRGDAPQTMRCGARVLISAESAAAWRRAHTVAA